MKYKRKPMIVEAVFWTGENCREMFDFLTINFYKNDYMESAGDNFYIDHSQVKGGLIIKTLEGECVANIGEYVVKGVKDEFYPVKSDIFEITHEKIEEDENA